MKFPGIAILALLGAVAAARPLAGQVGSTTDILTGQVKDSAGAPVAEAIVEAMSLETRVTRSSKTDPRGRYTILFPDGGGQYRIIVRAIGKTPIMRTVARQADEDRLVVNVTLGAPAAQLEEIVVRGNRGPRVDQGAPAGPGGTEKVLSAAQLAKLPLDASDLTAIASLAPGVVLIPGSDTTAAGFSVAGQRPSANSVTLDGLSFGGTSVPQDAVRTTRVITNSYDVARGQFSGGQIASTTRSGTNTIAGTGNYALRSRDLALSTGDDSPFSQGYNQNQFSGGLGGPIIKEKAFYFVSAQGRLRDDGLQSLLSASPTSLNRLGLQPDSAASFLGFLRNNGLPLTTDDSLTNRSTDSFSSISRFDFNLSSSQTLTLRGDYRNNRTDPSGVGALSVPAAGGTTQSSGGGAMATLSSRFGTKVINELRAYLSGTSNSGTAFNDLPQGRVAVVSALASGSQSVSNLSFGGNSGLAQQRSSSSLEVSEELSVLPGNRTHRLKAGLLYNLSSSSQIVAANLTGTYFFNSLADLEDNHPASFTRTLSATDRASTAVNSALYFGDTWRPNEALQVTYGGRLEHSYFGNAPAYNPLVDQVFGFRTDRLPAETHFSPRVGFTLTVGANQQQTFAPPKLTLRGGFGDFRSPIPNSLAAAAQSATGLPAGEQQLNCVGANVPVPDWGSYVRDPSTIPTACLGGANPALPSQSPTVTVFDPSFGAPRAWRASFGAQHRTGLWTLGLDFSLARGESQSGYADQNLGNPQFALAAEGGRPVYVPSNLIDPSSGVSPLAGSRRDDRFGQVLLLDSKLGSRSGSVTLSANGITKGGMQLSLSYTLSRSTDQSSSSENGGQRGFAGQTAGFYPNDLPYATSDFERRHSLLAVMTWPATEALELTAIGRLTSGAPYTPMVSGDINGDGIRNNDRAFIYNAATAQDSAIANGMTRLLATASAGARSCLQAQIGTIAARNSCRGPWTPSLDLQMNYRPAALGLNRRLTVSLVTQNLLAGVDQLVHGAANMHGWGQAIRPSTTLLSVNGFDPATGRFLYTVNERFGATSTGTNAILIPFQLGIQFRYTLGTRFGVGGFGGAGFGGGGFRGGGGAGGRGAGAAGAPGAPGDFASRFTNLVPNPIKEILDLQVGLKLSDEQEKQLQLLSDTLAVKNDLTAKEVQAEIAKMGANFDGGRMIAVIRPKLEEARKRTQAALDAAKALLTPEQWNYLPDRIKTPRGAGGAGPQRRPPGQ